MAKQDKYLRRNISAKLLESVQQMTAGQRGRVHYPKTMTEELENLRAEVARLRAESAEHDARFEAFYRHYEARLREVAEGPDRAALLDMVRNQAETIRELQAARPPEK